MQHYIRKKTYSIEEIFEQVNKGGKAFTLDGDSIRCSSRYHLYSKKGTECANCGLEGTFFAKEKDKGSHPLYSRYHLNLYAQNQHGTEIMITRDHIIPKAKGGQNRMSNYQPMCKPCNEKKGDK